MSLCLQSLCRKSLLASLHLSPTPAAALEQVEVGVDDIGVVRKKNVVFGVDLIVKAQWNLVSICHFT